MAATVKIKRWVGTAAAETKTDVTSGSTRLNATDAVAPGTSHPVKVPAAGTNYSYWASFQLETETSPSGTIDNIKFYTDGSNGLGTGITLKVGQATGYIQATGTEGETGDILNDTNHTSLTAAGTSDAFGYTSASSLSITGSTTGTEEFGNQIVLQIEVANTASAGASSSETMTVVYDET